MSKKIIVLLAIFGLLLSSIGYTIGIGASPDFSDYYLDQSTADYSYKICTDNDGWYWAVNGSDGRVVNEWTSTNASSVFQNVFDTLKGVNGGGKVTIRQGWYNFTNKMIIPLYSRLNIEGEGRTDTILNFDYTPASAGEFAVSYAVAYYNYSAPWGAGTSWVSGTEAVIKDLQIQCRHINMSGTDFSYIDRVDLTNLYVRGAGSMSVLGATNVYGIRTGVASGNGVQMWHVEASGFYTGMEIYADHVVAEQPRVADGNRGFVFSVSHPSVLIHPETYQISVYAYRFYSYRGLTLINPERESGYVGASTMFSWSDSTFSGLTVINPYMNVNDPTILFDTPPADKNAATWVGGLRYSSGAYKYFEGSGSLANTTANTFVITHGLISTPIMVSASFSDSAVDGWSWTADATTITITVTGTLGASTTCYWNAYYKP